MPPCLQREERTLFCGIPFTGEITDSYIEPQSLWNSGDLTRDDHYERLRPWHLHNTTRTCQPTVFSCCSCLPMQQLVPPSWYYPRVLEEPWTRLTESSTLGSNFRGNLPKPCDYATISRSLHLQSLAVSLFTPTYGEYNN